MKRKPFRAGDYDSDGEEYILVDNSTVLTLRWGCDCCKDTSRLSREEIAFRDRVVKALNNYDRTVRLLRKLQSRQNTLSYPTAVSVRRLLKDLTT
jgi:hypothetical protein